MTGDRGDERGNSNASIKRKHVGGNRSNRNKHDRKKFYKFSSQSINNSNLYAGMSGILFGCTPKREREASREAVLLIHKHYEQLTEKEDDNHHDTSSPSIDKQVKEDKSTMIKSLDDELRDMRENARQNKDDTGLFTKIEIGMQGSIFIQLSKDVSVPIEKLVENALNEAKEVKSPGVRHCIRIVPVHITCYAKPEDASKSATQFAIEHFPKDGTKVSFAIVFRAKCNSGAHRADYIPVIADGILKLNDAYSVNLTKPDITVIVEILKSTCFIGFFKHYFQLAKLNLREVAYPSLTKKPTDSTEKPDKNKETGGQETGDDENQKTGYQNETEGKVKDKKIENEIVKDGACADKTIEKDDNPVQNEESGGHEIGDDENKKTDYQNETESKVKVEKIENETVKDGACADKTIEKDDNPVQNEKPEENGKDCTDQDKDSAAKKEATAISNQQDSSVKEEGTNVVEKLADASAVSDVEDKKPAETVDAIEKSSAQGEKDNDSR